MGHSEPVSGIAGIMKAILALEHGIIPPTIGFVNLNPNSKSLVKSGGGIFQVCIIKLILVSIVY